MNNSKFVFNNNATMATITLRVNDNALEEVLELLSRFGKATVEEVVQEDQAFLAQRRYLHEQEALFKRGEMKTYTIDEADAMLEKVIREYEG
jgi:CRISPR/Cas system-associated protein Csm6